MQITRTPYSVSFMATVLLLLLFACHSTIANAAVALGATRVIYPANQKQVLLPVTNNDPASVYLIQSWIENAVSRSQDIAILRKVFITYPTVHTVE
ncbi:fimbria/pilus periplasmic chaperone [Escherichia coli]|nr:fimbria/pilus periplasmic chaperone [Escherichia coli]